MKIIAVLTVAVALGACATQPGGGANSPSATPSPSPTATVDPSVSPSNATPTPEEPDLIGELVQVVTDYLVVRSAPGTGSDSAIYMNRLNAPDMVYVIAGPERADGYEWYLVDPVRTRCYLGCDFEPQLGWVAAAGTDGERWLASQPESGADCPNPTVDEIIASEPQLWIYCFGGQELTLDGVVGFEPERARDGWAWDYRMALMAPGYQPPSPGCVDVCYVSLSVAFNDDRGVPRPLTPTRVTGHFDDAKAAECEPWSAELDVVVATHACRMVFVVTSWNPPIN